MMQILKLTLLAIPTFFIIDMLWLVVIARSFYQQQIGTLLKTNVNWWAAGLFYIIFLVGMMIFVVQPALEKQSLQHACAMGALFGLVTYATYDLTNLSVMKNWPVTITIVDIIWGTVLAMLVSGVTYSLAQKLGF
jgi:uncharacterized membrane protein